jgi:hypothetical protein
MKIFTVVGAVVVGLFVAQTVGAGATANFLSIDNLKSQVASLMSLKGSSGNLAIDKEEARLGQEYQDSLDRVVAWRGKVRDLETKRLCNADYARLHEAADTLGEKLFANPC